MRCFISINLPEEVAKKIIGIQDELPEFHGKKTESKNLHLTLKFLGEINEEKVKEIKEKLKEINFSKFESEIDELGVFSEKFIKIIWLHLTNCDELQKRIDKKLKDLFEPEKRFMSHLTIARVKSVKNKKNFLTELKKIKISYAGFIVDKFYLMKSELGEKGSRYEIIGEYNLA